MKREKPLWYKELGAFAKANKKIAIWQIVNTFIPYLILWAFAIYTIKKGYSYWLTLPIIILAAGLLIRIFIFFHDCCHGSFFKSQQANRVLGYVSGILTFTPYDSWRQSHATHHATSGNLDKRGVGDVWTMTLREYKEASSWKRFVYRVFRHPFVLFLIGPVAIFLISERFSHKSASKAERRSIVITNIAILLIIIVFSYFFGFMTYLKIQLPVIILAGAMGIWLFYVQHQYENVYWARNGEWDPLKSAIEGSSFYKLPAILNWFTGNIGYHHIHHLRANIPNYNLPKCYASIQALQKVKPLTFASSLKSINLRLYDEDLGKMVSIKAIH